MFPNFFFASSSQGRLAIHKHEEALTSTLSALRLGSELVIVFMARAVIGGAREREYRGAIGIRFRNSSDFASGVIPTPKPPRGRKVKCRHDYGL